MHTKHWFTVVAVAAAVGFLGGAAFTEEEAGEMDPMMAKIIEYAKPGPAQKSMQPLIGKWKAESKMFMGPGQVETATGTADNRWILGGRFLYMDYESEMHGKPFKGVGIMAHDNWKKEWQTLWLDEFGSGMMFSTGEAGEDGKTWEFDSLWEGPMGKVPGRYRYTLVGPDEYLLEGWMSMNGEETKSMEIRFTRRKDDAKAGGGATTR